MRTENTSSCSWPRWPSENEKWKSKRRGRTVDPGKTLLLRGRTALRSHFSLPGDSNARRSAFGAKWDSSLCENGRGGEKRGRERERERSCYYSTARFAFISPHTFALCSPGSTFSLPLLLPLVFPRFQRAQEHTCARTTPRRSQIRAARADGGDQNTVGVGIPSNQSPPQRKWDGKSDTDCL